MEFTTVKVSRCVPSRTSFKAVLVLVYNPVDANLLCPFKSTWAFITSSFNALLTESADFS
jgi:hypothetical protein